MKFEPGPPAHPKFWTRDVCKKRWKAMYCSTCCMIYKFTDSIDRYKSFKDALALSSKGNSLAGATAQQIAANATSLNVMRYKKCPSFEVFNEVFGESPNCKPVYPMEIGAGAAAEWGDVFDELDNLPPHSAHEMVQASPSGPPRQGVSTAPPPSVSKAATAAAAKAAAAAAAAVAAPKGAPATFHLQPSKKEKKIDLGEAYLRAQQVRMVSVAATNESKNRCDMIVAFSAQGKTSAEISLLLTLAGLLPMYEVELKPAKKPADV